MLGKCFLFLFLLLSFVSRAQNADINLLKSINGYRHNSYEGAMEATSNTTYAVAGAVPLAQLVTGFIKKDKDIWHDGIQSAMGLGYSVIVTTLFKYSIQKDRPFVTYTGINPYQSPSDPSFPSGHTSIAFATATTLSMCYPEW